MLNNKLINDFVNIIKKDNEDTTSSNFLYGTAVTDGPETYVKLDGSDILTPFEPSVDVTNGDRVCVKIEGNKTFIDTNTSVPTTGYNTVYDGETFVKTSDPEAPAVATKMAVDAASSAMQYAEDHGWSTEIGDNWIKTSAVVAENLVVKNGTFTESFYVNRTDTDEESSNSYTRFINVDEGFTTKHTASLIQMGVSGYGGDPYAPDFKGISIINIGILEHSVPSTSLYDSYGSLQIDIQGVEHEHTSDDVYITHYTQNRQVFDGRDIYFVFKSSKTNYEEYSYSLIEIINKLNSLLPEGNKLNNHALDGNSIPSTPDPDDYEPFPGI